MLMLAGGVLSPRDISRSALLLWRPLLTISSIMMTTGVAHRLGIFDRVTRSIEIRTRGPVRVWTYIPGGAFVSHR